MNRGRSKMYIAYYKGRRYGSVMTKEKMKRVRGCLLNLTWECIN